MKHKSATSGYRWVLFLVFIGSIVLLVFGAHVHAYVGYLDTPLQVQVTPSQNWIDQETRNGLIATYGFSLVNSCISAEPWCKNATSENGSVAACLRFVQLDLAQSVMEGCRVACSSGYVRLSAGGQCVTPEAGCQAAYGPASHFTRYDPASGSPQCGSCPQGYAWNPASSLCMPLATQLPDQDQQTQTTISEPKATSVVTTHLVEQPRPSVIAAPTSSPSNEAAEPTSTPPQAKRGFWAWLKHLFGF